MKVLSSFVLLLLSCLLGCVQHDCRTEVQKRMDFERDMAIYAPSYEVGDRHAEKYERLKEMDQNGITRVPSGF